MIYVDGVKIKTPSAFSWGLTDISDEDAGRMQDNVMHKNRICQKRKLSMSWNSPTKEETTALLQAFNPEYVEVTYPDSLSGKEETRTFYVGDRTTPVKIWTLNHKRYEQVAFELEER